MLSPQSVNLILHIFTEKSGKTIHLLKADSKPYTGSKKRKKVPLFGTIEQFHESKKKPEPFNLNIPGVVQPKPKDAGVKKGKKGD